MASSLPVHEFAPQHPLAPEVPSPARPPPLPYPFATLPPPPPIPSSFPYIHASCGQFGALRPIPQQMDPGMYTSGQCSISEAAFVMNANAKVPTYGVSRLGVPGYYSQYAGTFPNAQASTSDNVKSVKQSEGLNVLEQAILNAQKSVDTKEVLTQIRACVAQAEETVKQIGKLVMIDPSELEPEFVACPFNYTHCTPPEALFKHVLSCPSNPRLKVDTKNLLSSLQYLHTRPQDLLARFQLEDEDHKTRELESNSIDSRSGSENRGSKMTAANIQVDKGSVGKSTLLCENIEVDIWGGRFFYGDCPAVVQGPLPTPFPSAQYVSELEPKVTDSGDSVPSADISPLKCDYDLRPLLPSRLWFLLQEIEMWRELPTRCSSLVLQAAMALTKIRKAVILDWILVHGPSHGVVIDSAIASHIYTLLKICWRGLQQEASSLIGCPVNTAVESGADTKGSNVDSSRGQGLGLEARGSLESDNVGVGDFAKVMKNTQAVTEDVSSRNACQTLKVTFLDCPRLFQSGHRLASQLFSLLGPLQSKAFVLNVLKYCFVCSGRLLSACFVNAFARHATAECHTENGKDVKLEAVCCTLEDESKIADLQPNSVGTAEEDKLVRLELEAARAAVYERAVLESYLKSLNHASNSSKFQRVKEHEAVVSMAAEERRKRENYRAVLEYDGLIWHRSQLEEKNKYKTREEQLAEERDYKRRRMSYRGKKLKRNPTQVLHDIIQGHMEEITQTGGIGLFTKHPVEVLGSSAGISEVDHMRTSNADDVVNLDNDHPSTVTASNLDARNLRSPSDQSRGQQGRRGEHVRGRSSELSEDFNYSTPQGIKSSRLETGGSQGSDYKSRRYERDGSQGRSSRDYSRNSDKHGEDSRTYHSRNRSDYDRDFKEYQDRYENRSEKCLDRYVTEYEDQQNQSKRWWKNSAESGFERYPRGDGRTARSMRRSQ